jgi:hypothetical protein
MSQAKILPPYNKKSSYFTLTYRNVLLYWLASLIIYPPLILCIIVISDSVQLLIQESEVLPQWGLWAIEFSLLTLGLSPLALAALAEQHWRQGFKGRETFVLASTGISLLGMRLLLYQGNEDLFGARLVPEAYFARIICIQILIIFVSIGRDWRWFSVPPQTLLAGLLLSPAVATLIMSPLNIGVPVLEKLILGLWSLAALLSSVYSAYRLYYWQVNSTIRERNKGTGLRLLYMQLPFIACFSAIFILGLCGQIGRNFSPELRNLLISGSAFMAITLGGQPRKILSRQQYYWRYYWQEIRHDRLSAQNSPVVKVSQFFNRLRDALPDFFSINNRFLYVMLCLLIGGIIIPAGDFFIRYRLTNRFLDQSTSLLQPTSPGNSNINISDGVVVESSVPSFADLAILGLFSSSLLIGLYLSIWTLWNRSRFIVTQFQVNKIYLKDEKLLQIDPELNAIAQLATSTLVRELQNISILLKLRQVENVHLDAEDNNALFVTSGIDQDFVDQMEQIATVDMGNTGVQVSLGRMMNILFRLMARLRIDGTIQKRENNSIEIIVRLVYGNNQSAIVDKVVLPENSITDIDEITMRPIIRDLAERLYLRLGQVNHLGNSPAALGYFLRGLEASAKRNWWQAIYYYHKALQVEGPGQNAFGLGHYHLGTALLYQGEWERGLEHLRIAEQQGLLSAENHYMMAFALIYTHWNYLDERNNIFHQIEQHLKKATQLRRNFAEAYQLLGTAHYRRGRIFQRDATQASNIYGSQNTLIPQTRYNYHFRQAIHFFHRADRLYHQKLRRTGTYILPAQEQEQNLTQQRMTTLHQTADAMRSLGNYAQAVSYYQDMQIVYPANIRNITDKAKTYAMAQNWQRGEEYLRRQALINDIAHWNADVGFHMAWILLGGLQESLSHPLKKIFDRGVRRFYTISPDIFSPTDCYIEGIQFLDFALMQRPRYIDYWLQTNWFHHFKKSHQRLLSQAASKKKNWLYFAQKPVSPEMTEEEILKSTIDGPLEKLTQTRNLWIALRVWGCLPPKQKKPDTTKIEEVFSWVNSYKLFEGTKDPDIGLALNAAQGLKENKSKCIYFWERVQKHSKRQNGLMLSYDRTEIAKSLYKDWASFKQNLGEQIARRRTERQKQKPTPPSILLDRWCIDILCEQALLTARMYAEAHAPDKVFEVAKETLDIYDPWLIDWQQTYSTTDLETKHWTLGSRVSRFYRASLQAWCAWALLELYPQGTSTRTGENWQQNAENFIKEARREIYYHPLAMYVEARFYRHKKLYTHAIQEYTRLLDIISPYEPKEPIIEDSDQIKNYQSSEDTAETSLRQYFYTLEKVSGRQQFSSIVNPASIHRGLAETYDDMKQTAERIRHLMETIRFSSHTDWQVANFLRLALQLSNVDRYAEVDAIIEAMRYPQQVLAYDNLSEAQKLQPSILRSITYTRSERYYEAQENSRPLAANFKLIITPPEFLKSLPLYGPSTAEEAEAQKHQLEDKQTTIQKHLEEANEELNDGKVWFPFSDHDTRIQGLALEGLDFEYLREGELAYFIEAFVEAHREGFSPLPLGHDWKKLTPADLKNVDVLAKRAALILNPEKLDPQKDSFAQQVLLFLSRESSDILTQFAELSNNMAYNAAEMDGSFESALVDSAQALAIMTFLVYATSENNPRVRDQFKKRLAQYCDTFAWVRYRYLIEKPYRPNNKENLEWGAAEEKKLLGKIELFLSKGKEYDYQRSILHYHLARLYLHQIEEAIRENREAEITDYIVAMFRAWREAKKYDRYNRLHLKLAWVYNKIQLYKQAWETRTERLLTELASDLIEDIRIYEEKRDAE